MTRERYEQILFAHVPDEVVQDMLNQYVLELEAENAKLRELLAIASDMARDYDGDRRLLRRLVQELYEDQCDEYDRWKYRDRMHELGIEADS